MRIQTDMFQRNERGAFLLASKNVSLVEIAGVKVEQTQNTWKSRTVS